MSGFIEGENRDQSTLFPESLDDYVVEDNPVRIVDVFVDSLDLARLGFKAEAKHTGRPGYHPSTMLKLYIYGYLNRLLSSRRLEREAHRNVELMWLLGRLFPDFKTIADFRKDNGDAIRQVCKQFVVLCRKLDLLTNTLVAIDGSKFKAVNNRDKNFTKAKMERRLKMVDESIERYLEQIAQADAQSSQHAELKKTHLRDKINALKQEMARLKAIEEQLLKAPDGQISLTDSDARSMKTRGEGIVGYNAQAAVDTTNHLTCCGGCY
jgi:transposase